MYTKLILQNLVSSTFLLLSSVALAHTYPACGLGQPDCDMQPLSGIETVIAPKYGTLYKCSVRSIESGHKIYGYIKGADGFSFEPKQYISDTSGFDWVFEGEFSNQQGKIIVTNDSAYAGKASCSRACLGVNNK